MWVPVHSLPHICPHVEAVHVEGGILMSLARAHPPMHNPTHPLAAFPTTRPLGPSSNPSHAVLMQPALLALSSAPLALPLCVPPSPPSPPSCPTTAHPLPVGHPPRTAHMVPPALTVRAACPLTCRLPSPCQPPP